MGLALESLSSWPCVLLLVVVVAYAWSAANSKIQHLPGPFIARFSRVWRVTQLCLGRGPRVSRDLHAEYGPVVRIGPNHVSLSDPSVITTIYDAKNAYHKGPFYNVWKPLYRGKSIHTVVTVPHSSQTKDMKNMMRSCMTGDPLSHVPAIENSLCRLTDCIRNSAGKDIDFFIWPYYWAFDMTFLMLFGECLGFMDRQMDIKGLVNSVIKMSRVVPTFGMLPKLTSWTIANDWVVSTLIPCFGLPDPIRPLLEEIEKRVDAHSDLEHTCGDTVLCRIMQRETGDLTESKRDLIVMVLFEVFYAQGMELAVTLRSLFYVLLTNGYEYSQVTEIARDCHRGELDNISSTTYLNAVIIETLRIYPTIAIQLERLVPKEGLYANGYHIPPGTTVSVAHSVTHVNEMVFGHDAQIFRPARWVEAKADPNHMARMNNCLMMFGRGNRICPGKDLAILALRMLIVEIFGQFNVTLARGKGHTRYRAFWFTELEPLRVHFEPYMS